MVSATNRVSSNTLFYSDSADSDALVATQNCGGSEYQPICHYDFTTRLLDTDIHVFSTRHLNNPNQNFIDWDYFPELTDD